MVAQEGKRATLYLIPNLLGETNPRDVLPASVVELTVGLRHFVVEDVRSARRFLRKLDRTFPIDDSTFGELNRHTSSTEIGSLIEPLRKGEDMGVISEAGCPCVADPGANVVSLAHEEGFRVVPLVGPSSIILAQMASGLNGQSFAFVGYLPVNKEERQRAIKRLENRARGEFQTQLFIETPYRNRSLFEDLVNTCRTDSRLCIACDLTTEREQILTMPIGKWRKRGTQDLEQWEKRPTLFALL